MKMASIVRTAVIAVATSVSVATFAQAPALPTVFGQPLGAPVSYPECHYTFATFDPSIHLYEAGPADVCFKNIVGNIEVVFPISRIPAMLSIDVAFLQIIDGRVEGISTATTGDNFARSVIAQLSEKFGKPTTVHPDRVVLHAIPLTETTAIWDRGAYVVEYNSISGDLEHGVLNVRTTKAIAADRAKDAARAAQKVAL